VVFLGKENLYKTICILLFCLTSNLSYAQVSTEKSSAEQTATIITPPVEPVKIASMVASPNSCTLAPLEEYCEMTFHILWQTPEIGDYCLHDKESKKPLKCWYHAARGNMELEFSGHILENSKIYLLLDAKDKHLIASVDVPVTGTLKQRQRAQRRRRGFWRMF